MSPDNSPESGLRTDTEPESPKTTTSNPETDADADEGVGSKAHTPSTHGIANPPDIGASDSGPQVSEADVERKTESDSSGADDSTDTSTETVVGRMVDGSQEVPRGDGGSGSGAIFDDTDITKWGFFAFVGFELICASFAALILYFIFAHGVHHIPWFMLTGLGVLIFAFLAAAFGGLAAAKSMMDAAGGLASKSQSQNSEHRE